MVALNIRSLGGGQGQLVGSQAANLEQIIKKNESQWQK
jgi:hypothetical protein